MAKSVTLFSRARVICPSCTVADTVGGRLRGLVGRRGLADGEGLLLKPSGSVHTCFMRFPIDVVFLDRELRVLAVSRRVKPWRMRMKRGARAVLELRAGEVDRVGIGSGDRLTVEGSGTGERKENVDVVA